MVILFLSLGFIFSVVALHCKSDLYPAVAKRDRGFMLTPRRSDCETDETILVRTVTEGDRDVSGYDSIQVRVKQGRQESRHESKDMYHYLLQAAVGREGLMLHRTG